MKISNFCVLLFFPHLKAENERNHSKIEELLLFFRVKANIISNTKSGILNVFFKEIYLRCKISVDFQCFPFQFFL